MTPANSPTYYEAFSGPRLDTIRVLLVHTVSGMTPPPLYSTLRRFPGTRKHTRRHANATLRTMNILWEMSESKKKRRSYTWPGTMLSISSVRGQESRLGPGVSHGALRLGARNDVIITSPRLWVPPPCLATGYGAVVAAPCADLC